MKLQVKKEQLLPLWLWAPTRTSALNRKEGGCTLLRGRVMAKEAAGQFSKTFAARFPPSWASLCRDLSTPQEHHEEMLGC